MKLLKCHVENFGRLHDYEYTFTEGVNYICQDNGWGKSTFAAFIRAMFYGLDGERKRSLEENERKRYAPWQGGAFGGSLDFEVQGKRYRITRMFDSETPFELRDLDTNLPSADFSEAIGEELFGIDRNSFLRTAFISQRDCETVATDDIHAKIGNLSDVTDDINQYENAFERLTRVSNELTPKRVTGSIKRNENEITRLEMLVNAGREIGTSLDQIGELLESERNRRESLREEMDRLSGTQKQVAGIEAMEAKRAEWSRLREAVSEKEVLVEEARSFFPGDIPDEELLEQYGEECVRLEKCKSREESLALSDTDKTQFLVLKRYFGEGYPSAQELEEKLHQVKTLQSMQEEILKNQVSEADRSRLEALKQQFGEENPGEVSEKTTVWNDRNTRKQSLGLLEASLLSLQATGGGNTAGKTFLLWAAMGGILFLFGVIGLFMLPTVVGIILMVLGAALIVFGWMQSKKPNPEEELRKERIRSLELQLEESKGFIARVDADIEQYLSKHGREFQEVTVFSALSAILEEALEYKNLKERVERAGNLPGRSKMQQLEQSIDEFVERFRAGARTSSYLEEMMQIKTGIQTFQKLEAGEKAYLKQKEERVECESRIQAFLRSLGFSIEEDLRKQVETIQEHRGILQTRQGSLNEAKKRLEQFEAQNDIRMFREEIPRDFPSLEEISARMSACRGELEHCTDAVSEYISRMNDLGVKYDEWENQKAELENLREIQAAQKKKYDAVESAKAYLEKARENMIAKYAKPLLQSFTRYYEMITGGHGELYHMDATTRVTYEEQGKQRELNTLSAGYRDLTGVCLRLALVDAMYPEEKPAVIMDDPFTNLDDTKMAAGKKFLEEVGKEYQLLYFTCSRSRV